VPWRVWHGNTSEPVDFVGKSVFYRREGAPIRGYYSVAVRKVMHGEVDKDLVKLPVYEIERQLLS